MFLRSMFGRRPEDLDGVGELMSMTELRDRGPVSSPITPAYVKMMAGQGLRGGREEGISEVDEACRSFENYLVEMIVEEGKVRDLMDVEELLTCWNSLKSPVFVDLVSRYLPSRKTGEIAALHLSKVDDGPITSVLRGWKTNVEEWRKHGVRKWENKVWAVTHPFMAIKKKITTMQEYINGCVLFVMDWFYEHASFPVVTKDRVTEANLGKG
ncbi:hypothetical protein J5N97_014694 [Dioscorea zingiberensis]|uniref:OVATE domain-containing protein n=1 Tax=Dioscorea zingiberensis TaxID=325984 RepID=A0A9D5CSX4_9LILI|nr:hypothetical protein J5N97_014694 [Dioscorea zingiberensis]